MPSDFPRASWAVTLLIASAILTLMLSPQVLLLPGASFEGVDLAYHLVAFAALMLPSAFLDPAGLKLSFPAGITLGALIEILQPLVGRNASGLDLIADVVGLAVGFSIGTVLRWMLLARDD